MSTLTKELSEHDSEFSSLQDKPAAQVLRNFMRDYIQKIGEADQREAKPETLKGQDGGKPR